MIVRTGEGLHAVDDDTFVPESYALYGEVGMLPGNSTPDGALYGPGWRGVKDRVSFNSVPVCVQDSRLGDTVPPEYHNVKVVDNTSLVPAVIAGLQGHSVHPSSCHVTAVKRAVDALNGSNTRSLVTVLSDSAGGIVAILVRNSHGMFIDSTSTPDYASLSTDFASLKQTHTFQSVEWPRVAPASFPAWKDRVATQVLTGRVAGQVIRAAYPLADLVKHERDALTRYPRKKTRRVNRKRQEACAAAAAAAGGEASAASPFMGQAISTGGNVVGSVTNQIGGIIQTAMNNEAAKERLILNNTYQLAGLDRMKNWDSKIQDENNIALLARQQAQYHNDMILQSERYKAIYNNEFQLMKLRTNARALRSVNMPGRGLFAQ